MTSEEILRGALAFILCQEKGDLGIRRIAFKALKEAYGNEILGNTVEEHDQLGREQFEQNWAAVAKRLGFDKK